MYVCTWIGHEANSDYLSLRTRTDAIIRVKAGRMRNFWFPKGQAEYMTRFRFKELGLTDAAIGVRDRTFGTKLVTEEDNDSRKTAVVEEEPIIYKKKEVFTLPVSDFETAPPPLASPQGYGYRGCLYGMVESKLTLGPTNSPRRHKPS